MLEPVVHTTDSKRKNKTINNTNSDKIMITKDKLYRKLNEYKECIAHKNLVYTFLGIFLSLLLAYVTCDFKDILGLSADMWKGVILTLCAISGVFLAIFAIKAIKYRKVNINELIERICKEDD